MGLRKEPPKEIILQISEMHGVKVFVETGTYYGNTAVWAASYFDTVITIEYSQEIFTRTAAKYANYENIKFMHGDSRSVLREVVQYLNSPAVFWLDSHWSGGETGGQEDECPLIEELEIIMGSDYSHFIFIDDARLFLSPPPKPHKIEHWPSIDKVIQSLSTKKHKYRIVIIEDVIIAVPLFLKQFVDMYCQALNTKIHEEYVKKTEASLFRQGLRALNMGIWLIGRSFGNKLKLIIFNLKASSKGKRRLRYISK